MQNILNQNQIRPINVYFRSGGSASAPIMLQCMSDDKVSDVIEKYRNSSGDRDMTKKFIFNAMALNPNLTLEEAGMADNDNVFVVATRGVKGG